jgi:hypothetical protein
MAQYRYFGLMDAGVIDTRTGAPVPDSGPARDEFDAWVSAGGVPDPQPRSSAPARFRTPEEMERAIRILARLLGQYTGKTAAQVRADFVTLWNALD